MAQTLQTFQVTAPGFMGLNTQDASLDLQQGWALIANNAVIDQYGRVGSRKGWTKQHTTNATLGSNAIKAIGELVTLDGTRWVICAGNNKLFKLVGDTLTELTYGGGGTAPTITDSNWQMCFLGGDLYLYQRGHDPLEFSPNWSTTQYRRVSEEPGYNGTVQKANAAITAYGRVWNADTSTDKMTVQFSDTTHPERWGTGTAGTLDTTLVWPKGGDTIVGLGAHNGFLFIFGMNNILVYSGATDPTTMTLSDVITGIGCIGRDTIQYTGSDLIFLSATGVRSVLRTIQEKSAPLRDLSKNVRNDLMTTIGGADINTLKAAYSPFDAIYVLAIPITNQVYCFDMKFPLQDGSARVTTWDSITPSCWCVKQDSTLLMGKNGYVGKYDGYLDDTASYQFQYYTQHTDFGAPQITSIPKKLGVVIMGTGGDYLTVKWGYDFSSNFRSQNILIPSTGIALYGVSEYNASSYSNGVALNRLWVYPTGAGITAQFGYEYNVNGAPISIQKIEIMAKQGKIV